MGARPWVVRAMSSTFPRSAIANACPQGEFSLLGVLDSSPVAVLCNDLEFLMCCIFDMRIEDEEPFRIGVSHIVLQSLQKQLLTQPI